MGFRGLVLAGIVAVALGACAKPDPLAEAREACGGAAVETEAKIAACSELIESGKLDEANRSIALSNRGAAYDEGGDVIAAKRDFEAALKADSANMRAVRGRASILIASGQLDAAEPLVDQLLASGELGDVAHYLKGEILSRRRDAPGAIAAFDAAIAANQRFAQAFASRGRVKQGENDQAGALADFDAALAINPQLSPALAGRCWARVLGRAAISPPPAPTPTPPRWPIRATCARNRAAVCCNCGRANGTVRAKAMTRCWRWNPATRPPCSAAASRGAAAATMPAAKT